MTLNGAIMQLVELHEHSMMPEFFKPAIANVIDTISELEGPTQTLPPAQPQYSLDEFCTDCKEYDQERHSCPRWNRVIRQTLEEAQHQRTSGYERVVYCGECAHMMPDGRCREFADDNIRPSASDYCSAGEKRADMKEEQDGENM